MKCITWNIEWATAQSAKGKRIKELIQKVDPDVVCFTEATLEMCPPNGYVIESDPDYGYPNHGNRRKVLLWSKQPWQRVDIVGSKDLPNGRFASGITQGIRFVGVCIPWFNAHVKDGSKDRIQWQDHLCYLDALGPLFNAYCKDHFPVCVTGDFNQRIPRARQPVEVAERLAKMFESGLTVATSGIVDDQGHQLIDHVATCGLLSVRIDETIPKKSTTGRSLSDHAGIISTLTLSR
jgi:exonuclease III